MKLHIVTIQRTTVEDKPGCMGDIMEDMEADGWTAVASHRIASRIPGECCRLRVTFERTVLPEQKAQKK